MYTTQGELICNASASSYGQFAPQTVTPQQQLKPLVEPVDKK
jgi:hypothetical protein